MIENRELTGSGLKIIAVITMFIDHFSLVIVKPLTISSGIKVLSFSNCFFSGNIYCIAYIVGRLIGRLAFPLFCFCLVEGFKKTRSRSKYFLRMIIFALISEIPFDLVIKGKMCCMDNQNVFFTLVLGFAAIWIIETVKDKMQLQTNWFGYNIFFSLIAILVGFIFAVIAELIRVDYGFSGVFTIVIIYMFITWGCGNVSAIGAGGFVLISGTLMEIPVLFNMFIIKLYKGKKGNIGKYFFYVFYPFHLALLYLISRVIY